MRVEFVATEKRSEAKAKMPWATIITKVYGGYKGFESIHDYESWNNQK